MRFLDVKLIANINITKQICFYTKFVVDLNYTQLDGTAHDINIRTVKLFKDFNNTNCTDSMAYIIKLDVICTCFVETIHTCSRLTLFNMIRPTPHTTVCFCKHKYYIG